MLVRAGDVDLNVLRAPSTPRPGLPTVVCVHGFVIDDMSSFWFTLAGAFPDVADVVCYDMRGHGRSPVTPSGYTVADQVDDLFALLDSLDVTGPVHLAGFSYGSAVVLTAALRHPERVSSVIVIDGNYPVRGWAEEMALTTEMVAADLSVEGVMERLEITSRRRAERLTARIDRLLNHTELRKDVQREPDLTDEQLRSVAQPLLCCYGDQSDLLDRGRRLAELVPDVEYHEVPGVGHRIIAERASLMQSLIRSWLDRHGDRPAPPRREPSEVKV